MTPCGVKSDGLVIHNNAISVTVFNRSRFNESPKFSPHCSNSLMNHSTGIGLDLLIGVKVCVFIKPDTKRLMSVVCVGNVFQ